MFELSGIGLVLFLSDCLIENFQVDFFLPLGLELELYVIKFLCFNLAAFGKLVLRRADLLCV